MNSWLDSKKYHFSKCNNYERYDFGINSSWPNMCYVIDTIQESSNIFKNINLTDWSKYLRQDALLEFMWTTLHNHTIKEETHRHILFVSLSPWIEGSCIWWAFTTIRQRRIISTRRSTKNKKNKERRCKIWSQKLQCDLSSLAFMCPLWKWTISYDKWMNRGGNVDHEVLEPKEWIVLCECNGPTENGLCSN
jgi:hypothetical protein